MKFLYNILFIVIYAYISNAADIKPPEQPLYGLCGREYMYNQTIVK